VQLTHILFFFLIYNPLFSKSHSDIYFLCSQILILFCLCSVFLFVLSLLHEILFVMPDLVLLLFHFQFRLTNPPATANELS